MKITLFIVQPIVILWIVSIFISQCSSAAIECSKAPAKPGDRRQNKDLLKIATYNVEWLFYNRSNCPGTGCPWTTKQEAIKHMETVAQVIESVDADIITLAEVQDCEALKMLIGYLSPATASTYLPYLVTGTDTATGQNMGILTKVDPKIDLARTSERIAYPVPNSRCGSSAKGTSAVSKHFYTMFEVKDLPYDLYMVGVHFLAYPVDPSRCSQREAQAKVIADLVNDLGAQYKNISKTAAFVVLGDFNDYDGQVLDSNGDIPISNVLTTLKNPFSNVAADSLTNVASSISVSERYTSWYDKNNNCSWNPKDEFTSIDHLLISKEVASGLSDVEFPHPYQPACKTYNSDHYPLVITLDISKLQQTANGHISAPDKNKK